MINFAAKGQHYKGALCGGVNTLGEPGFVGNCQANMLSHLGRNFTYDRTADGYQRGEGCGAFFLKLSAESRDIEDRLACLVGSCANQDGRSASLTAPNGPSQQAVIRNSLRMAGVTTNDIAAVECHRTGTALGDPIEVGALLAVLEHGRENPLPHTSAKSNISHLESGAGVAGLLKCVIILLHATATPNVHLKLRSAAAASPSNSCIAIVLDTTTCAATWPSCTRRPRAPSGRAASTSRKAWRRSCRSSWAA